jgi:hypothetical protein
MKMWFGSGTILCARNLFRDQSGTHDDNMNLESEWKALHKTFGPSPARDMCFCRLHYGKTQ